MKYLVPAARQSLEDCQRMAAIFVQHHCDTRPAGQLYAAWRQGSPAIRKRILDAPELFFKAQRQEVKPSTTTAALLRDLEMVAAIVNRAHRRLAGAAATELRACHSAAASTTTARPRRALKPSWRTARSSSRTAATGFARSTAATPAKRSGNAST